MGIAVHTAVPTINMISTPFLCLLPSWLCSPLPWLPLKPKPKLKLKPNLHTTMVDVRMDLTTSSTGDTITLPLDRDTEDRDTISKEIMDSMATMVSMDTMDSMDSMDLIDTMDTIDTMDLMDTTDFKYRNYH